MVSRKDLLRAGDKKVFMDKLDEAGFVFSDDDLEELPDLLGTPSEFKNKRQRVAINMLGRQDFFTDSGEIDSDLAKDAEEVSEWVEELRSRYVTSPETEPRPEPRPEPVITPTDEESDRNKEESGTITALKTLFNSLGGVGIIHNAAFEVLGHLVFGRNQDENDRRDEIARRTAHETIEAGQVVIQRVKPQSAWLVAFRFSLVMMGLSVVAVFTLPFWPLIRRKNRAAWLRRVGQELVAVKNENHLTWKDLNDLHSDAFSRAVKALTIKVGHPLRSEAPVDDTLVEVIRRVNLYYGKPLKTHTAQVNKTAKIMDRTDAIIPNSVYEMHLDDRGDQPLWVKIDQYLKNLN